ncbi:ABC transporter ATP-binding protein [Tepiditoga spiralis]|uniref:ABC transporter ATP-binding protein n=1 Tax=Tepiditoga spiralis TaxID=2108365 RepID=A0A7G1G9U7_9BACT|nr:ABC transporter ATP-binding protein [Tepiditoga spiralis]BBE30109.1 ABC transporter ATP-binding protein [Tepiditoga spiralis]
MKKIKIKNLYKVYGAHKNFEGTRALNGINLEIESGQVVAIMGPSGCGKTTLFSMISGIDTPTSGEVWVKDKNIFKMNSEERATYRRNNIGLIFQEDMLIDYFTIYENISLLRNDTNEIKKLSEYFGINKFLNKYPKELSFGERQKVAACRAFINNQDLILADEPTGNLDSNSSKKFIEYVLKLNNIRNDTFLMATHDPFVASYCNRVVFLNDGKIIMDIYKKESRRHFLDRIFDCLVILEGEINDMEQEIL